MHAKYQFHVDYWLILSDFKAQHGTVHVQHVHAKLTCIFYITPPISLIMLSFGLIFVSVSLADHIKAKP
jgi:hypothetical protein